MEKNKGITLVALIITIIILLILAGLSILALTGTGLFEKAKLARNRTEEAEEIENQRLQEYEYEINEVGGILHSNTGGNKFINIDENNTNPEGALPSGAKLIEIDGTKGIVIEDSKNNQWTWIEVPKTEVFKTATESSQYEEIKTDLINYVASPTNYRESGYTDEYYVGCGVIEKDGRTAQQVYEEMYQKMLSSVYTYGGFWISTYELGIKGSKTDVSKDRTKIGHTDITEQSLEAVSQADTIPYNYIYCSEAQTLASKMTTDSSKVSSLLFGIQWDLVCKYLEVKGDWDTTTHSVLYYIKEDSSSWGNYRDSTFQITSENAKQWNSSTWIGITGQKLSGEIFLTTGASKEVNKMNIYDFAGNVLEWTLERTSHGSYPCVARGGSYYSTYGSNEFPVANRFNNVTNDYTYGSTTFSSFNIGARCTLF